ncbi:unnamed protein product [Anisakis simplex]|uniref:Uncharacterized protein n=1 Tax=Anisakis simplex TaxID=6269 RepID=A0A0M3J3R9_ANISI|nr:unnamed protein product [Anisakis simplex]
MEPNQAILERLRAGMLNIENDKKRRKSNVTNEQEALIIRPKLSQTNALLNADEAVQESSEYAATHPDALSAFRIDL